MAGLVVGGAFLVSVVGSGATSAVIYGMSESKPVAAACLGGAVLTAAALAWFYKAAPPEDPLSALCVKGAATGVAVGVTMGVAATAVADMFRMPFSFEVMHPKHTRFQS